MFTEMAVEAGLPPGVFNFVTGPGSTVGQELIDNDGIDGIVFTGSKEVGLKLMRDNAARTVPRPLIIEMGGKNPAIVTSSADLDKASDGVMRSAFGAQGQKCSACSRVYIQKDVRDKFVQLLVEKTKRIKVGNPLERDVWMGPVINEGAVRTYLSAVERAKKDGGKILVGGRRITEPPFDRGYFVEPTIIDGLPPGHPLFSEELFVPITVIADVMTLDQALDLANRTEYGLTAGIYSENEDDLKTFFDRIQAGVTYANRRAGATTGAWPGINPFGGWKASGSTGRGTGGPYYVQQFMREQSRVTRSRRLISRPWALDFGRLAKAWSPRPEPKASGGPMRAHILGCSGRRDPVVRSSRLAQVPSHPPRGRAAGTAVAADADASARRGSIERARRHRTHSRPGGRRRYRRPSPPRAGAAVGRRAARQSKRHHRRRRALRVSRPSSRPV